MVFALLVTGITINLGLYYPIANSMYILLFMPELTTINIMINVLPYFLLLGSLCFIIPVSNKDKEIEESLTKSRVPLIGGSILIISIYIYQILITRSLLPFFVVLGQEGMSIYIGVVGFILALSEPLYYPVIAAIAFLLILVKRRFTLLIAQNLLFPLYLNLLFFVLVQLFFLFAFHFSLVSMAFFIFSLNLIMFIIFITTLHLSRTTINLLRVKERRTKEVKKVTKEQIPEGKYRDIFIVWSSYGEITPDILNAVKKEERKLFGNWLADKLTSEGKHELAKDILIEIGEYEKAISVIISLAVYNKAQGNMRKAREMYELAAELYRKIGDMKRAEEIENHIKSL